MSPYSLNCLSAALGEVQKLLLKNGFDQSSESDWRPGQKNLVFIRSQYAWITEQVDVLYPEKKGSTEGGIEVVLRVNLKGRDGLLTKFDGIALSQAIGKEVLRYYFPSSWFFKRMALDRYTKLISEDTKRGLVWFEHFNSPEKCLARLIEGKTNLGELKPDGASGKALIVLQSWMNAGNH